MKNRPTFEEFVNESLDEARDYGQGNPWNPVNTQSHLKKLMKLVKDRPGPYSLLLITPHNMRVVKQEINIKDPKLIPAYFRNWASKFTDSIIRLEDGEGHIVESSINELDVIPNKKWIDWDLALIDKEGLENIWKMYTDSYAKEGLDFSASDMEELAQKYSATQLIDIDNDKIPDAFIIYRKYPKWGNKIALLGTNGKKDAKRSVVKKVLELVNTKGWFLEASKKMEELMKSNNAPVIKNDTFIMDIVPAKKEPEIMEDGYFKRKLSKLPKKIVKRFYGIHK